MKRRKRGKIKPLVLCFLVIMIFVATFFGVQYFTKSGIFHVPGVVYYDESLNVDEVETLNSIFTEDVKLDKDVYISARDESKKPDLNTGGFLYDVFVPVTDFYDARMDTNEYNASEYDSIPIDELDFNKKLLSVDGSYYLDNYNSGAKFRIITFKSDRYEEEIKPLVEAKFLKSFPEKDTVLSMAQTGVTALSRGMNAKLKSIGDANYFSEKIGGYLSKFDLTHTSNESSFTSYATDNNICSDPRFINTLVSIGLDIVELTGNHNQDCGNEAAADTIDLYNQYNIKVVGGGKTATDAATPLAITNKNNNIMFFAYNFSTGGATYDDTPGANQYYEEKATEEISEAKKEGKFVIVDVQYYECSNYDSTYENTSCDYADSSAGDQIGFFRHLVDLGADVVVGTSAHQPQTFELYNSGAIYYGLGNLFFDQVAWPGTTRSLILEHYFYNGKLLQTRITPTVYDNNMQTKLLDNEAKKWFIERLMSARP